MNPPSKRLRQISIFESFAQNKKQKSNTSNMTDSVEIRNLMLAAAEKRLSSESVSNVPSLDSDASTDSVEIRDLMLAAVEKRLSSESVSNVPSLDFDDPEEKKCNVFAVKNVHSSFQSCSKTDSEVKKRNVFAVKNVHSNSQSCSKTESKIETGHASNSQGFSKSDSKFEVSHARNSQGCSKTDSKIEVCHARNSQGCSTTDSTTRNNDVINSEAGLKGGNDNQGSDYESGFENSAELFPDELSSFEDHSAPDSAELFPEERDSGSQTVDGDDDDSDELDQVAFLNRRPDCNLPLPKLEPLENHSIMFSPHIRPGCAPRPYPPSYRDKWDAFHVRMPCSPQNRYPIETRNGDKRIESRWDLICRSLRRDIGSSKELEEAIMRYNAQYADRWNFQGLHAYINKHLREEEREHFFETILPVMIEMTLNLPNICTRPVPLLKQGKDHYVTLSQKQIGCLLLNAFFCTFPRRTLPNRRNKQRYTCEFGTYPDINFNRLFAGIKYDTPKRNAEKLKCLFNYFKRITSEEPSGTVTFHRQCIQSSELPTWNNSTRGIRTAVVKSDGLIEIEGQGMLQVDFANKFVGGGVLGHGCVQEEIRFVICPELIVSRLFVECLSSNEVLVVTGVEQYNKYSGYCDTFKWEGNYRDVISRDSWGRRHTELVAMDATHFKNTGDQFKPHFIRRELNKAYCGFYENALPPNLPAVATGNWGCGAFKSDPKLKFLIQLMAASEAGRNLLYCTFGNKTLKKDLQNVYNFLTDKNLSVGDVWRLLLSYIENVSSYSEAKYSELFDFIYSQFVTKEENYREQAAEIEEPQFLSDSDMIAAEKLIEALSCDGSSTDIEDNFKI